MILTLFCVFVGLSLILITLGLFRPEHTELALIGFLFLFLLSLVVLNDDLYYKNGENTTSTFDYTTADNVTLLTSSYESFVDNYEPITFDGGISSHLVGYWLSVMSILGFIGVILGLRKSKGFK